MKIAYLSTFYPFRGGIAQFNAALYRYFEQYHDINAYTFFRQYPELIFPGKSQYVGKDDPADKIPSIKVLDTINPAGYVRAAAKIKAFEPDLFITKFWMPFFAPSLGWVASALKENTINISILDNVLPHEKRMGDRALTKYFLNQNHGFIVMSETVKNDLLTLNPKADFEFHNHPLYNHFGNIMDKAEAREKLGIPKEKKVLLFFGFIRSYKGLDILLEAIRKMPEDYYLVIAGETYGSFDEYSEYIKKYKMEDRVSINTRYISDTEVSCFFSAADVCVLPYKSATQSGIIGITYHFELPVIATDVGGLKEMIEPWDTGIMVAKPEPDLLRHAILDYFQADLSERFKTGIRKYKEAASWDSLGNTIINYYGKLKDKLDRV